MGPSYRGGKAQLGRERAEKIGIMGNPASEHLPRTNIDTREWANILIPAKQTGFYQLSVALPWNDLSGKWPQGWVCRGRPVLVDWQARRNIGLSSKEMFWCLSQLFPLWTESRVCTWACQLLESSLVLRPKNTGGDHLLLDVAGEMQVNFEVCVVCTDMRFLACTSIFTIFQLLEKRNCGKDFN